MNTAIEQQSLTQYFSDLFRNHQDQVFAYSNGILNSNREEALKQFENLGIPKPQDEKYKYTNLKPYFEIDYNHLFKPRDIDFNIDDMFKCDVPELDTNVIILLNGYYYNRKKPLQELDSGIIIGSMAAASKTYPGIIQKHYNQYAADSEEGLVAMNTAFAQDGIFLYVPKNKQTSKPIQIINLLLSDENLMVQHRNLFVFEENSEANVVICDHTLSPHRFLTNQVTEIYTGANAKADITKIQNEHNNSSQITHTYAQQKETSHLRHTTVSLHGGLIRNNLSARLDGEGCENDTVGLFLSDQGQHIDNFINIDHAYPHSTSNQLYKGVLNDYSSGAFSGKILVREDAQKTMAYQSNNNLLLTDDAKMNAKPQLEIYADDVKCSHGATVGQLNEEAMHYIRSRGISVDEARFMLMHAFTYDVIKEIKIEPLRERIEDLVDKRLRGELSRCNHCEIDCGRG